MEIPSLTVPSQAWTPTAAGSTNWRAANEAKRQEVNSWIRTSSAYDEVIDFDRVLRDPNVPTRILPAYASADHGHPNNEGYEKMADAIHLQLFGDALRNRAVTVRERQRQLPTNETLPPPHSPSVPVLAASGGSPGFHPLLWQPQGLPYAGHCVLTAGTTVQFTGKRIAPENTKK